MYCYVFYCKLYTLKMKKTAVARSTEASTMYQGEHVRIDVDMMSFPLHEVSVKNTCNVKEKSQI